MAKAINIDQFPPDMASILSDPEKPIFLERDGKPIGVVVSPDTCRNWEERGNRLIAIMDKVGDRNQDKTESEVDADIESAIREVRLQQP
jgi:hypothetical protein